MRMIIRVMVVFLLVTFQSFAEEVDTHYLFENEMFAPQSTRSIEKPENAERSRVVNFNVFLTAPDYIIPGDTLILNLFQDTEFQGHVDNVSINVSGTKTISGKVKGKELSHFVISTTNNKTSMIINTPETNRHYQVVKRDNVFQLIEIKQEKLDYIQEAPPVIPEDIMIPFSSMVNESHDLYPDDPAVIGVMIVYTPAARRWAELSSTTIHNIIAIAMQNAQTTADNSNTGAIFKLVHSAEVNHYEGDLSSSSLHLAHLRTRNSGYMDEIHEWRDLYGADLVSLFAVVHDVGGIAYLLSQPSGESHIGFSLTRVQQATSFTHVHEMGHNIGLHHHKEQNFQPGPGLFSYSAGWRWPKDNNFNYCTVMTYTGGGYFPDERSSTRVPHFSNPDISYNSPTGHIYDGDNARTVREIKHVIAAYRKQNGVPEVERNALIQIYKNTKGDEWVKNTNWKLGEENFSPRGTECDWYGVTCTNNRVTELDLSSNNLYGNFPKELIFLRRVENLYLDNNVLSGEIPPELITMGNLNYFDICYNYLYSVDNNLISFLDSLQPGWNDCQYDPYFEFTPQSLDVSNISGSSTFHVFNGGTGFLNWSAKVNDNDTEWLSISGSVGINTGVVTVEHQMNPDEKERVGFIEFTSTVGKTAKYSITQGGTSYRLIRENFPEEGSIHATPDKQSYTYNESVTLTAISNDGFEFSHWSGDISSNTNPITIKMDSDKSVTANFLPIEYKLNVSSINGSVSITPDKQSYTYNESVTLTAIPNDGYDFTNWSGDLSGNENPITIKIISNKIVVANFLPIEYKLNVSSINGSVSITPDKQSYTYNESVTLTAISNDGFEFSHWSGDLSGNTNPITIKMDSDKSVTANFKVIIIPTVEPPMFEPGGGIFSDDSIDVRITCFTTNAIITYTTNGEEPTKDSTSIQSGETVKISIPTVLKAKAWVGGLASVTTTASYSKKQLTLLPPAELNYPIESKTGEFEITWSASVGASGYQLLYSSDNGENWELRYDGDELKYYESISDGNYLYKIRSYRDNSIMSEWVIGHICNVTIEEIIPVAHTSGGGGCFINSILKKGEPIDWY